MPRFPIEISSEPPKFSSTLTCEINRHDLAAIVSAGTGLRILYVAIIVLLLAFVILLTAFFQQRRHNRHQGSPVEFDGDAVPRRYPIKQSGNCNTEELSNIELKMQITPTETDDEKPRWELYNHGFGGGAFKIDRQIMLTETDDEIPVGKTYGPGDAEHYFHDPNKFSPESWIQPPNNTAGVPEYDQVEFSEQIVGNYAMIPPPPPSSEANSFQFPGSHVVDSIRPHSFPAASPPMNLSNYPMGSLESSSRPGSSDYYGSKWPIFQGGGRSSSVRDYIGDPSAPINTIQSQSSFNTPSSPSLAYKHSYRIQKSGTPTSNLEKQRQLTLLTRKSPIAKSKFECLSLGCDATFSTPSNRARHQKEQHGNAKKYLCVCCKKEFSRNEYCQTHKCKSRNQD